MAMPTISLLLLFFCGMATTRAYEYRLVGPAIATLPIGPFPRYYGRLEVRASPASTWGTVCDDSFDAPDATVACRSLGINASTTVSFRTATNEYGSSTQPILFDDLACVGNETELSLCPRATSHNCGHSEDIVVGCGYSPVPTFTPTASVTWWEYRIVGGATSTSGRLEARPSSNDTWGTVCSGSFGSSDATVACRSLGLTTSITGFRVAASASEQGNSTQPIHLAGLACASADYTLDQCVRSSTAVASCTHALDVWVVCGETSVPSTGPSPPPTTPAPISNSWQYRLADGGSNYGRLEVRAPLSTSWGTVCDDAFGSTDATVACRSLGLPTSPSPVYRTALTGEAGSISQSILMDDLACSGTENRLDLCSRASSHNCGHSEDVVLGCGVTSIPSLTSAAATPSPPVVTPSPPVLTPSPPITPGPPFPTPAPAGVVFEFRLVGGSTTYGRLEVRPVGDTAWGTVCDDSFDTTDAVVACRTLGFSAATANTVGYRTAATIAQQGVPSQMIWFDDLSCVGTETSLDQCSRAAAHNCGHSEDVLISCAATVVPTTTTSFSTDPVVGGGARQYRLAGGTASTWGRLETRLIGASAWGTVCGIGFDGADALTACRSLGIPTTLVAYRSASSVSEQGASTQPIAMSGLGCTGAEVDLDQCPRAAGQSTCSHSLDIVLACGYSAIPGIVFDWSYRLVSSSGVIDGIIAGRLEVRPAGQAAFGTVCDDNFGTTDATVACRSLGLSGVAAYRTVTSSELGSSTQTIWMDEVGCTGTEAELRYCPHNAQHDCSYTEAVFINCGGSLLTELPTGGSTSVSVLAAVRLAGNGWQSILASGSSSRITALTAAVQLDLADLLSVSAATIRVEQLSIGSLIIAFSTTASSAAAAALMTAAVNATAGQSASSSTIFRRTQAIYTTDTTEGRAGETVTVLAASAVASGSGTVVVNPPAPNSPGSNTNDEESSGCNTGCIIGILVVVGVVAGVVVVVVYFVLSRPKTAHAAPQPRHPEVHNADPPTAAGTMSLFGRRRQQQQQQQMLAQFHGSPAPSYPHDPAPYAPQPAVGFGVVPQAASPQPYGPSTQYGYPPQQQQAQYGAPYGQEVSCHNGAPAYPATRYNDTRV